MSTITCTTGTTRKIIKNRGSLRPDC